MADKFDICESCINRELDPFRCESCMNGENYESDFDDEDAEELTYEQFQTLLMRQAA